MITKGDVGGAQTHVVELALAQLGQGLVPVVVAGSDGPAMERLRNKGVEVHIVPTLSEARARLWHGAALRDIRAALGSIAPDIVHGHSSNGGLLARLASRRDGYPSVYTAHGWPFQRGAPRSQRAKSFVAEFVGGHLGDGVICLTEVEADRALRAKVVRRSRLWVVPNGLDDVAARRDPTRDRGGAAEIVMVARFAPPKLQSDVIRSLTSISDLRWNLTFVGDGPQLDQCIQLGRRLLGDRVRFLGHRDDVDEILSRSDIAVLWSRYEGMPIALLEAMRAELCCVASDLPGVRSLFGEPSAGLIASSEADLADTVRAVIVSDSLIQEYGGRARRRFEQSFSVSAMEAATRRVYDAVLARREGRQRPLRSHSSQR